MGRGREEGVQRARSPRHKPARTRTPATPSFRAYNAADHLRCCQPARHSFVTAGATASVKLQERPTASLMPNCTNTGFAAALLACLVTTGLMNEAHAYPCSADSVGAYKGCADVPCADSLNGCNNGVWDAFCYEYGDGTGDYCYHWAYAGAECPDPNSC